jgi:hypothetical protein
MTTASHSRSLEQIAADKRFDLSVSGHPLTEGGQ